MVLWEREEQKTLPDESSLLLSAVNPLRASLSPRHVSLLLLDEGVPRHTQTSFPRLPDLSFWRDHDWTCRMPAQGRKSFDGWFFFPFGTGASGQGASHDGLSGVIAVDGRMRALTAQDHAIARAHAEFLAECLGTLAARQKVSGNSASPEQPDAGNSPSRNAAATPPAAQLGFLLWNDQTQRLTGDPCLAALCGLSVQTLRHGVEWPVFMERLDTSFRAGPHDDAAPDANQGRPHDLTGDPLRWLIEARGHTLVFHDADNRRRHVQISAQAHRNGCTGTVIEVDHGQNDLALKTSQAFVNSMLVSANDCVKILTLDGTITFVNHGAVLVLDLCSPADMLGVYWPDVWQERGRKLALDAIEAAAAGLTSHFQEYVETTDGRKRLWDVVVTPILGPDGKPERILGVSRDMTVANQEHERLELALAAGTIVGMWLWDARNQRVTGDLRMAETLHLPPSALADGVSFTTLLDCITPEDRPVVQTALDKALEERQPFRCEFRLRDDGTRSSRWIEANGSCTYDQSGHISHFPGILLDIDAPKRQTLKRDALVMFGDELRTLDNEADILALTARTLGVTIEADRSGFADVDHERELAQVTDSWRRGPEVPDVSGLYAFRSFGSYIDLLIRGEVVAIDDVRIDLLTADQSAHFAPLHICALLNVPIMENGVLQALVLVHFSHPHRWDEITLSFVRTVADRSWAAIRQIRAQEALRRMNETLEEQVLRRTRERDRLWAISADLLALTDRDGRLRYLNPSWQNCFGDKARDWIGSKAEHLVHPDDMARATEALSLLREGKLDHGVDLRFLHQDGKWHTFNWSGSIEGEDIYLIGRDVTDRIALEDQLRQSQKMEAVGQLTGGLAHDFNNILAGIGGALSLLTRRIEQGRTEGLERYITAAQGATDRAAALTHRLLAFSRRQTLDPQAADINALIIGMEDLLAGTVGPGVVLELCLDETLGPALVDTNQLENALLNLSINARDAMPEGGHLQIATSRKTLGMLQAEEWGLRPGAYQVLSVSDTGVGMNAEIMARAFDPFFTTKPLGKGTGLGLSMIYGFARQSGGRVSIASTPGKGTAVQIWLPSHAASATTAPVGAVLPRSGDPLHNLRVLLVDDEETLRFTMRETLEDWGAIVQEAGDGTSALALLNDRERLYDVLITDVGLPGGLNGRQLADAAQVLRPGLPVLFITGYAEQALFDRSTRDEKIHILPKPFTTAMLDDKLRSTLSAA
ncbi:PAS domain-containing protein [Asaia lannensis]|uniref:histidine kinase n=1 Tax=Asaia lannensis NBRC 102526 TaxID=1307926 RepID=A0ABT1CH46_9PROT|nr:PAS domain-containing protein [Asaia lannensis]MCO6160180.1 PAS domain-containing protein [Asaia lannensis NBRC 102526]GBQ99782.1 signal transduction histidine kinase [Asaia lannensis NBRC 102526]